jgi:hypothetical protein
LVAAGFFWPAFSCTTGPVGTVETAGAAATSRGTVRHTIVTESASQLHGSPTTADSVGVASGFAVA